MKRKIDLYPRHNSRTSEPFSSPDSRRPLHETPLTSENRVTLLKGLPVAFRPHFTVNGRPRTERADRDFAGALIPPVRTGSIAPPMPEGEEYDSETEAERRAAWEEYHRLTQTSGMSSMITPAQGHTAGPHQYGFDHPGDGYFE